jgi:hypothetical protein
MLAWRDLTEVLIKGVAVTPPSGELDYGRIFPESEIETACNGNEINVSLAIMMSRCMQ